MSLAESALPAPATRYPGVAPRALATLIDGVLGFIAIGIPLLILFGKKSTTNVTGGTTTSYSTTDPKVFVIWGVLALAYYVLFETAIGATPGKLVLGLRVRDATTGTKCTARAAAIRNLLRVVDGFPYVVPYLVGAIAIWQSDSHRRIGDRMANTIVTYR